MSRSDEHVGLLVGQYEAVVHSMLDRSDDTKARLISRIREDLTSTFSSSPRQTGRVAKPTDWLEALADSRPFAIAFAVCGARELDLSYRELEDVRILTTHLLHNTDETLPGLQSRC